MGFDFGIITSAVGTFLANYGGAIAAATAVASTAVTAVGQHQAAKSQEAANRYNADVAQQQALDAERRGSMAEAEHRTQSKRIIGAMRAETQGVVPDTGSGAGVFAEAAEYGARGAAVARLSGGREAFGYRSQAELDRYQGRAGRALAGGRIAGTALTGATRLFATNEPWWHSLKRKPGEDLALAPEDYRWG